MVYVLYLYHGFYIFKNKEICSVKGKTSTRHGVSDMTDPLYSAFITKQMRPKAFDLQSDAFISLSAVRFMYLGSFIKLTPSIKV